MSDPIEEILVVAQRHRDIGCWWQVSRRGTPHACGRPVAGITVDVDSRRLALVCAWHLGHNGSDRAIPLADILDAIDERDCG
ncbi:hypothetical protein BI041_gp48 [Propionibacterium phage PFR2]|uniref:Uncharacterized protein n=2 Tax=Pulverervirus PFR1 TaxID=2170091 RepID=A0A173G9K0_9CAUD|nr:hypothetical protein [Propionibacterium freudenreichii]YP_009287722.1 hypothetical protein BI042_gp46 [Propionibacterium phage PFR1]YP_009290955.1 hypothetical protein BI041_gp48 [Propionibacterium phage PFR2]ANH49912.1 hypothetical protein PFR_46 [Propionibacterium phage PFR1]ANH49970.1 hypothetical protein PFR2_46 [Propionibacterium phage PFR2]MDK9674421.1 hypothetical protein [Propionibacterium freudenreichii]CEI46729.1 Protein of unknown function [Propionibacterium freudenreichii]SCQ4